MSNSASKAETPKKKPAQGDGFQFVQKAIAGDTYLVMADSALQLEDEFQGLYYTTEDKAKVVLKPPFEPKILARLPNQNNILSQCIEAMEVNIDGTGHEFMPAEEGGKVDESEHQMALDFFAEPYPNKSFVIMRRKLRRDLESMGYGYLEVLRTISGEVVGLRNLEGHMTRLVKLDAAVQVTKKMMRGGSEIDLTMWERERRYVQKMGKDTVYYREFGSSRELHRTTGEWASPGQTLEPQDRATELLAFGVNPDVETSYFVPRWINQLPSVLGSRKAEEANLEFFDAGGMPPAIIFVQGGTMAKTTSDQLRAYLSGKAKNRQRAVVVETMSTSGEIDRAGTVQVKVERFGSENAKDSMYQNYDKASEEHVRTGFRLPPLFLGRASDYNYATAVVAYMVAEEQVFRPERTEFDETINKTIIKALGFKTLKFVSKPITLKSVDNQLKSIEMLKGLVKEEDYVAEIAAVGGVALTYDEATAEATKAMGAALRESMGSGKQTDTNDKTDPKDSREDLPAVKNDLIPLAKRYAQMQGLLAVKGDFTEQDEKDVAEAVAALKGEDLKTFTGLLSTWAFGSDSPMLTHAAGCCQ